MTADDGALARPGAAWRTSMNAWLATPPPLHEEGYRIREIPRWSTWTAGTLIVAGIVHLVMLPAHLAEARGTGFYFFLVGGAQVVWGCLFLLKPTTALARLGLVALSLAPVGLWILTRALRSPWGAGPEPLDFSSVATVALEVLAAVILVLARLGNARDSVVPSHRSVAVLAVLGLLVGGASYGVAMTAEATVPWLGEPDATHHHAEVPANTMPDAPAADGHPHDHG